MREQVEAAMLDIIGEGGIVPVLQALSRLQTIKVFDGRGRQLAM
jgi:hypothetical protein